MNGGPDALAIWKRLICNPRHERTDRELVQMSNDERTRVFADIGGAQEINPEDPEFVTSCLLDLDMRLAKIKKNTAFFIAEQSSPDFTNDYHFRISFLRADNFDVDKSSNRIIRHFQEKLELFGTEKLARNISLNDLSLEDMEALEAGGLQILPNPDQFGRFILCSRQVNWKYRQRENLLRAMWYITMSLVEDEDVQRRGIVGLGYSVGHVANWSSDYEMVRRIISVLNSVPARFLAIYTCFNSQRIETVVDVAVHMFNSFLRARFRAIHGTRQECNYQLMLMGITHTDIPVTEDGKLLVCNHLRWLEHRRQLEARRMV